MPMRNPIAMAACALVFAASAFSQDSEESKTIQELKQQLAELQKTVETLQKQQSQAPTAMDLDRAISELSSSIEARQGSAKGGPNVFAPAMRSLKFTFEERFRGEFYFNRSFGAPKNPPPPALPTNPLATSVSPINPTGFTSGSLQGSSGPSDMLDDDYRVLNRFRINMSADINDKLGAFATFQFSNVWGSSPGFGNVAGGTLLPNSPINDFIAPVPPGTIDAVNGSTVNGGVLGFYQLYVVLKDVYDSNIDVTIGRFTLDLGQGRILSPAPWDNVGRSFDGLKAEFAQDQLAFTAFATSVVEGGLDWKAQDSWFFGGWLEVSPTEGFKLTPYTMILMNNSTPETQMVGKPWTIGSLFEYSVVDTGLRFYGEVNVQQDTSRPNTPIEGGKNIGFAQAVAWALGAELAIPMDDYKEYRPLVGVEFAQATKWFNDMYAARHGLYGLSDVVNTWNNVQDLKFYVGVTPAKDTDLTIAYHILRLTNDPGGSPSAPQASISKNLGQEIDIEFTSHCSDHVDVAFGWGWFINGYSMQEGGFVPGAAYGTVQGSNAAGTRENAHFLYLSLVVRF